MVIFVSIYGLSAISLVEVLCWPQNQCHHQTSTICVIRKLSLQAHFSETWSVRHIFSKDEEICFKFEIISSLHRLCGRLHKLSGGCTSYMAGYIRVIQYHNDVILLAIFANYQVKLLDWSVWTKSKLNIIGKLLKQHIKKLVLLKYPVC